MEPSPPAIPPDGRRAACPAGQPKILAFCSPNPGSAPQANLELLAAPNPFPNGIGPAAVVLGHGAADLLDPAGHRSGEAVKRRSLLEDDGEFLGFHGGDRGGVEDLGRVEPTGELGR